MTMSNEDVYPAIRRPPIMLVPRKVQFSCQICTKPGWGPANMRVHAGKCRAALIKINAKLAADRRKRAKLARTRNQFPAVAQRQISGEASSEVGRLDSASLAAW